MFCAKLVEGCIVPAALTVTTMALFMIKTVKGAMLIVATAVVA